MLFCIKLACIFGTSLAEPRWPLRIAAETTRTPCIEPRVAAEPTPRIFPWVAAEPTPDLGVQDTSPSCPGSVRSGIITDLPFSMCECPNLISPPPPPDQYDKLVTWRRWSRMVKYECTINVYNIQRGALYFCTVECTTSVQKILSSVSRNPS